MSLHVGLTVGLLSGRAVWHLKRRNVSPRPPHFQRIVQFYFPFPTYSFPLINGTWI
jgi:hypothetical protein